MNGMAAVKRIANIEKGIRDCAKIEMERKIMSELKKTKYRILNTGKEKEKMVEVNAKSGAVQKTEIYQYSRITINKKGNLEDHLNAMVRKCETSSREIDAIVSRKSVGKEEIKVKLKLFEICLITALTAWRRWRIYKTKENDKNREDTRKNTKKIFQLPVSITSLGIIIETRI